MKKYQLEEKLDALLSEFAEKRFQPKEVRFLGDDKGKEELYAILKDRNFIEVRESYDIDGGRFRVPSQFYISDKGLAFRATTGFVMEAKEKYKIKVLSIVSLVLSAIAAIAATVTVFLI